MLNIRPLTAEDKQQAKEIWELRFHDSLSFIDWFFSERYAPETSFCAEEDGRIISIAHGSIMQLRVRGVVFPAMMISGVATLPGYEGRGIMKQVLLALFTECRRRNIPLAFSDLFYTLREHINLVRAELNDLHKAHGRHARNGTSS